MLEALQNAFFQTGDALTTWLSAFSSFLWGWPLLIMLLGTHLYLTIILRFPQRYLLKALKLYFVKDHTDKGDISPFSSLMVALAANIGAGNIIGVGVAIAAGGPGAIFWCWLTGVLGMATRYSEGLLAIKYRVENKDGNMSGGPMFVLERGMKCKWLGVAFAVFTAIAAFGIGNPDAGERRGGTAPSRILHSLMGNGHRADCPHGHGHAGGHPEHCQGMRLLRAVHGRHLHSGVPVYSGRSGGLRPSGHPVHSGLRLHGEAAAGGVVGAAVMTAMRTGVARGLFSNEAGLGSAAIASAAAQNRNPVRQALISSSGPFWDTVVICALTGIVLTTSIIAHPDISCSDGPKLTTLAFSKIPYMGSPLLTLSLVTFVVSTILGWSYFGEKALEYLGGIRLITPYRVIWVAAVFTGCVSKIDLVWVFADCANGLMALPNLISLLALSGVLVQQTRYYLWQHRLDDYDDSHIPEGR